MSVNNPAIVHRPAECDAVRTSDGCTRSRTINTDDFFLSTYRKMPKSPAYTHILKTSKSFDSAPKKHHTVLCLALHKAAQIFHDYLASNPSRKSKGAFMSLLRSRSSKKSSSETRLLWAACWFLAAKAENVPREVLKDYVPGPWLTNNKEAKEYEAKVLYALGWDTTAHNAMSIAMELLARKRVTEKQKQRIYERLRNTLLYLHTDDLSYHSIAELVIHETLNAPYMKHVLKTFKSRRYASGERKSSPRAYSEAPRSS